MKRFAALALVLSVLLAGCTTNDSATNSPAPISEPPADDAEPPKTPVAKEPEPKTPAEPEPEPEPLQPQELWNGTHDHSAGPAKEAFTAPEGYTTLYVRAKSTSTGAVPKADDITLRILDPEGKEKGAQSGKAGSVILGEGSEVWTYEVTIPAMPGDWTLQFDGISKAETRVTVTAMP